MLIDYACPISQCDATFMSRAADRVLHGAASALTVSMGALTQAVDPTPLETAMGGLRYLAVLLSAAEANGIVSATALSFPYNRSQDQARS